MPSGTMVTPDTACSSSTRMERTVSSLTHRGTTTPGTVLLSQRPQLADAGYGGRPQLSFAGRALEDIWQQDGMLLTYAAVLEAEKPETLHRACELLQDLDNYQRITEDAYGYGQQRLQETLGLDDEAIYELDGYMDFEKYGQDCMENDCVTKTEFGLLRRLEPPFPEQTQGQRMM